MVVSRGLEAGALGVGLLLTAAQAEAQAAEVPRRDFAVEYRAPAACADRASLVAAIQARTQRPTALVDEAPLRFRVELLEGGRSTLSIEQPEGVSQRELDAASCSEAVASVAVIAAMVLDTEPSWSALAMEPPSNEPVPSPSPAPPAAPRAPSLDSDGLGIERPRAAGIRLTMVAGVVWESAVAPQPPLGGTAGIEVGRRGSGWWAPRGRAEVVATALATETLAAGEASFRLLAGRLSLCPVTLELARRARLVPCATFDAGVLSGQGGGSAENVTTRRMPWLAAGMTARLELDLARWATLEGFAGLRRLTRHDRFVFRPQSLVYEVPGWSGGVGLGLAVHFD
jgi:hypothetical protein